jgi:integrase
MIGITTAIVQDKRIIRKDGTYAIKLRITYNREQKYYPINISLTPDQWEKTQQQKPRNEAKEQRIYFNKIEQRAIEIIKELHPFSFQSFEKKFNQKTDRSKDVLSYLNAYTEQLSNDGRSGTADSYKCAFNSFTKFIKSKNRKKLQFAEVTPEWLAAYEKWMLEAGRSLTSIGIYLRSLRTIMNIGIEEGIISQEFYPFGKRKYQIPAGRNIKKALTLADIKKIVNYMPTTEAEQRARDLWVFSYLCNGANVKDISRLQYKNIDQSKITFVRAKTERITKQDTKPILVVLLPEIKAIIDRWGAKPATPETYVFGILKKNDTPDQQLPKVRQATKTINKYMKRIGDYLELDINLTTYTARHSFATVLKRSGAPTEFISESLGHKDLRTTENYLDSFEDTVKESFQKQLLNFD